MNVSLPSIRPQRVLIEHKRSICGIASSKSLANVTNAEACSKESTSGNFKYCLGMTSTSQNDEKKLKYVHVICISISNKHGSNIYCSNREKCKRNKNVMHSLDIYLIMNVFYRRISYCQPKL